MSERRAGELMGVARSSCRYQPKAEKDAELRSALRVLALERPRFGYRRLAILWRRQGWEVNRERVYRLYREEGLAMRRRKRRRVAVERLPLAAPTRVTGWRSCCAKSPCGRASTAFPISWWKFPRGMDSRCVPPST